LGSIETSNGYGPSTLCQCMSLILGSMQFISKCIVTNGVKHGYRYIDDVRRLLFKSPSVNDLLVEPK
jgi:hypothetical protein